MKKCWPVVKEVRDKIPDTHMILDKSVGQRMCKGIVTRHHKKWKLEPNLKDRWANECSDRLRTLLYVAKKEMQGKPRPRWIEDDDNDKDVANDTPRSKSLASAASSRIHRAVANISTFASCPTA